MYALIFIMTISNPIETIEPIKYDSLEACQRVATKAQAQAESDIIAAKQLNIKVRFECRRV